MMACGRTLYKSIKTRLRIWGSDVRIVPGAPFKSDTYRKSPFEKTKLKRLLKRFLLEGRRQIGVVEQQRR
jgi:hypothetical protein